MADKVKPFMVYADRIITPQIRQQFFKDLKKSDFQITRTEFDSFLKYWRKGNDLVPVKESDLRLFVGATRKRLSDLATNKKPTTWRKITPTPVPSTSTCRPKVTAENGTCSLEHHSLDTTKLPTQEVKPHCPNGWICVERTSCSPGSETPFDESKVKEHKGGDHKVLLLHEDEYTGIRFWQENALNHWRPQDPSDRNIYNALPTPGEKAKMKRVLLRRQFPVRAIITEGMRYIANPGRVIDPQGCVIQLYQLANPEMIRIRQPRTLEQLTKRKLDEDEDETPHPSQRKNKSKACSFILQECEVESGRELVNDNRRDNNGEVAFNPFQNTGFVGTSKDLNSSQLNVGVGDKNQPQSPSEFFNSSDDEELGKLQIDGILDHLAEEEEEKRDEDKENIPDSDFSDFSFDVEYEEKDEEEENDEDDEEGGEGEDDEIELPSDTENDISSSSFDPSDHEEEKENLMKMASKKKVTDSNHPINSHSTPFKTASSSFTSTPDCSPLKSSESLITYRGSPFQNSELFEESKTSSIMEELGSSDYDISDSQLHDSFLHEIDGNVDGGGEDSGGASKQGHEIASGAKRTFWTLQNNVRGALVTYPSDVTWKAMLNYNKGNLEYLPYKEKQSRKKKFVYKSYKRFRENVKNLVNKKYRGQDFFGHLKIIDHPLGQIKLVDLKEMSYVDIDPREIFPLVQQLIATHVTHIEKDIETTYIGKRNDIIKEIGRLEDQLPGKKQKLSELECFEYSSMKPGMLQIEIAEIQEAIENFQKDLVDLDEERLLQLKYVKDHSE